MKYIVFGGDGFCGWPTSLHLADKGHKVTIVDNFSRRAIDQELGSSSLTNIASPAQREATARALVGDITFVELDVCEEPARLSALISEVQPDVVVQFAEQRAAPYSMIGDKERRYTVDNNVTGTHNICSALVDIKPDCHFVHLGTMGVYGYSKEYGAIPEGYLDINITQTNQDTKILYPANPGSIYHLTKCLDQLIFQFYAKNWGLRITDLHQGIVWGVDTDQTRLDPKLANRFDYDGVYGTVLNRFLSQAANGFPLSIYGTGGQARAFIHISDTARCIEIASSSQRYDSGKVTIYNQVSEVRSVIELATLVADQFGVEYDFYENPRNEQAENELQVSNEGLRSLGFDPITLSDGLMEDVKTLADLTKANFSEAQVLTSPKWR